MEILMLTSGLSIRRLRVRISSASLLEAFLYQEGFLGGVEFGEDAQLTAGVGIFSPRTIR